MKHAGSLEAWASGNNSIEFLWVAERARGVGLVRRMSDEMCCNAVSRPLPESVDFWRKVGFQVPAATDKDQKPSSAHMGSRVEGVETVLSAT